MKLKSAHVEKFKRFADMTIDDIPECAKLVVLLGPNGSGKSSLFDAFSFRFDQAKHNGIVLNFEQDYHSRVGCSTSNKRDALGLLLKSIAINFHGVSDREVAQNTEKAKKAFYFRSAYRVESHFSLDNISKLQDALQDEKDPLKMINVDARVSENYRRIVSETVGMVYSEGGDHVTKMDLRNRIIGDIRKSMDRVFGDLMLEGPGNPMEHGTFFFTKGDSKNFKYLNLSGGEKASFDLLLDFVVKRQYFNDTVFCIDEPELHMHTGLQGKLLQELYDLIPDKCQLWMATHSIGMMRKAQQLAKENPGAVAFIDFEGQDFDKPVTLKPITPDRAYWRKVFHVALDDLADLVVPRHVILCEGGRRETGATKNAEFDATCLNSIFRTEFPDVLFVSAGGTNDIVKNSLLLSGVLTDVAPGIHVTKLMDRDDRSDAEIADLKKSGTCVLPLRDLENYLWDDEILQKLCVSVGKPELEAQVLEAMQAALMASRDRGKPTDDVKAASCDAYVNIKQLLGLLQCGNLPCAFARDTLVPLITSETCVYSKLRDAIFGPGNVPLQ